MILILSENSDLSTTHIIEWLDILDKKWIRINKEDEIDIQYNGDDIEFKLDDVKFKLSEISSFWYRRGFFNIKKQTTSVSEYNVFQQDELYGLSQYLYYKLHKIHHLDSIKNLNINKLIVNSIARDLQLLTPQEFIFSNKEHLENVICNSQKRYISKPINGSPTLEFEDFILYNYTTIVDLDKIQSETFFPSLVQDLIEKKYELRIFYLAGEFYSMAIFSQKDKQTQVDFREYNNTKPNRRVPFKLPSIIEERLETLMKKLDLDSGSIDMIVTPDNEYVFLEVNPVGQFGMTSFPCNYNLEKRIANYLSHEN